MKDVLILFRVCIALLINILLTPLMILFTLIILLPLGLILKKYEKSLEKHLKDKNMARVYRILSKSKPFIKLADNVCILLDLYVGLNKRLLTRQTPTKN